MIGVEDSGAIVEDVGDSVPIEVIFTRVAFIIPIEVELRRIRDQQAIVLIIIDLISIDVLVTEVTELISIEIFLALSTF